MELIRKRRSVWTRTFSAIGATAAACAACCISIPLIGPVLALLGISSFGAIATEGYVGMGGVFVLGIGALLFARYRCNASCSPVQGSGCGNNCKT